MSRLGIEPRALGLKVDLPKSLSSEEGVGNGPFWAGQLHQGYIRTDRREPSASQDDARGPRGRSYVILMELIQKSATKTSVRIHRLDASRLGARWIT